jgi:hypothetical protein
MALELTRQQTARAAVLASAIVLSVTEYILVSLKFIFLFYDNYVFYTINDIT